MKKYRCSECKHTWEAEEQPYICPACGNQEIKEIKRMPLWAYAIGAVALIIVILLLKGCRKDRATIDFEKKTGQLEIKIVGPNVKSDNHCNYRITIYRDGSEFGNPVNKDRLKKTFDNPGNYTIDIKWDNKKKKKPDLEISGSLSFSVSQKPQSPFILRVLAIEDRTKKLYKVNIICDSSLVPLPNTEYSYDGINYQSSPIFANLKAGKYTFYARNIEDIQLVGTREKSLPEFQEGCQSPSDDYINKLLKRIAQGDRKATQALRKKVDPQTPVVGITSPNGIAIKSLGELIDDGMMASFAYEVKTIRDSDNTIIKITKK